MNNTELLLETQRMAQRLFDQVNDVSPGAPLQARLNATLETINEMLRQFSIEFDAAKGANRE